MTYPNAAPMTGISEFESASMNEVTDCKSRKKERTATLSPAEILMLSSLSSRIY